MIHYPKRLRPCTPEELQRVTAGVIEMNANQAMYRALGFQLGDWNMQQVRREIAFITMQFRNGAFDFTIPDPQYPDAPCFALYGQIESPQALEEHLGWIIKDVRMRIENMGQFTDSNNLKELRKLEELIPLVQKENVRIGHQYAENCFEYQIHIPNTDKHAYHGFYNRTP